MQLAQVSDNFLQFMQQRQARQDESPPLDPGARRNQWLADVEELYRLILDDALGTYIASGQILCERASIELNEPRLGSYEVDRLTLYIGDDQLIAEPVGTMLIACRGRVDVTGPLGSCRLVLLDSGGPAVRFTISEGGSPLETSTQSTVHGEVSEPGWYLATSPPGVTVTRLTPDAFRQLVMDLVGE